MSRIRTIYSLNAHLSYDGTSQTLQEQERKLLEHLQTSKDRHSTVLKILDGVVDVGMRNGEMRRILEHDPDIAKALNKISAEQKAIEAHIIESKQAKQEQSDKASSAHTSQTEKSHLQSQIHSP